MKKLITLLVFATIFFSSGLAQTCDTLFNLQSILDTPAVYLTDTTNSGYVSGNNSYGDLAKAEGFAAITGDSVYTALLYFGVAVINPDDTNSSVAINIWDNTGTSFNYIPGAPGNITGTGYVTLGQIAASITNQTAGILVNFSPPVAITTDTIYVGVVLPTTSGDTLALFTNAVPPGTDGNGWEWDSDNSWASYTDDWSSFSEGGLGNYIAVDICGPYYPTGINAPASSDALSVKIFPNPANDQLNLEWNSNNQAEVAVYDVTGNLIKSFTIQGAALNTFNVQDLASGAYIIRVTDRQTNQQQSTLFTKI